MVDTEALKRSVSLAAVIRSYGIDLRPQGSKLFAHCPFHDESTPSFSLYRKNNLERAGCKGCGWDGDVLDFIQRIEGVDFKAAVASLERHTGSPTPVTPPTSTKLKRRTKPGKIIATYDYTDAEDKYIVFQVVRRETLDAETNEHIDNKHFSQRRPDPDNPTRWIWNLQGITRELYHLQAVRDAETLWLVEGEKDVHSLESAGVAATTNAGGASAPWEPRYTTALAGKHIIVCGDSDQPGQERDATVMHHLHPVATSIRFIKLPYIPGTMKDVTDWLEAGQTLRSLLDMAVPYEAPAAGGATVSNELPSPNKSHPVSGLNEGGASGDGNRRYSADSGVSDDSGPPPRHPGWRSRFPVNDTHGNPKPMFANALYALRAAPEWDGVLFFNEFSVRVIARNQTPWGTAGQGDYPWTDHEDRLTSEWLQHNGVLVNPKVAGEAVATVARERSFHPVREYLSMLQWDAMPRLDTWLSEYLGVPPSHYSAAVGARWMISAVARVFWPGCKADYCLVLEGKQGLRKSGALQALFEPWFTDEIADLGSKDSSIQLQGVWCVEIAELDSMRRVEIGKVKAFMSRAVDRFRPPYGHRSEDFPRQCVFSGTVNNPEWMPDPTGGRRFWPVKCGAVSLPSLKADRDQLWAEALLRYKDHEVWYLEDVAIEAAAREEQMERYEGDAWDPLILKWIEDPDCRFDEHGHPVADFESSKGRVTITDVLVHCIGKPKAQWTQADKLRVQRCLTSARYDRRYLGSREKRQWVYVSPNYISVSQST